MITVIYGKPIVGRRTYGARPPWARRLMLAMRKKHGLEHFDGTAWRAVDLGQGSWMVCRTATNGDRLEFHPYLADNPNPSVKYYKRKDAA